MARYIDADLLLKDIDESVVFSVRNGKNSPELRGAKKILDQIIKHISTVDVVEVVRCCKCEYSKKATINDKGFKICPASGMEITDNDFCSYGERREANDN